jgi:hypothetical protein
LGGAADLNKDKVITAAELFQYVSETVKQESGGSQIPRFHLAPSNSLPPIAQ